MKLHVKNLLGFLIYLIILQFLITICCAKYSTDELLATPEAIVINGREYILESYLWRDFQPICPPDGEPLIGVIFVIATDSLQFPSALDANYVWVIKDNDVWDTELINCESPYGQEYKLKKRTKESGPKWGPEIYVDVVVQLVDDDSTYLLRASNQYIIRTD